MLRRLMPMILTFLLVLVAGACDYQTVDPAPQQGYADGDVGEEDDVDGITIWVEEPQAMQPTSVSVAAGEVTISFENHTTREPYTLVLDGADLQLTAAPQDQATGTVTLEPGTYEYFLAVPSTVPGAPAPAETGTAPSSLEPTGVTGTLTVE